jgi:hypothetical protein
LIRSDFQEWPVAGFFQFAGSEIRIHGLIYLDLVGFGMGRAVEDQGEGFEQEGAEEAEARRERPRFGLV